MAEGRRKDEWSRLSELMVLLAEPHRDRKQRGKPYTPEFFNPYSKENEELRRKFAEARRKAAGSQPPRLTDEQKKAMFTNHTSSPAQMDEQKDGA